MTAFELLEAMGGADERWLTEQYNPKQARLKAITKYTAIAASLFLVTGIGIGVLLTGRYANESEKAAPEFEYVGIAETAAAADFSEVCTDSTVTETKADLPVLEFGGFTGTYGMEAIMAYDVSEIIGSNPWTKDCVLTSLPVYRNLSFSRETGISEKGYSEEELLSLAETIAEKLDSPIRSHQYSRMTVSNKGDITENLTAIDVTTDEFTFRVSVNGMVSLNMTNPASESPGDEASVLAIYSNFAGLLDYAVPTAHIITSYNIYGEAGYEAYVWDAEGDERQQILGFAFDTALVSSIGIHLSGMYQSRELIGEYPLISWEEAAEMLLDGRYISTIPDATFGKPESYDHVELVYRTNDETIMPYYKFRVHLEEWDNMHFEGEKLFGAYYVPAVSREYLDESTFWDGTFN